MRREGTGRNFWEKERETETGEERNKDEVWYVRERNNKRDRERINKKESFNFVYSFLLKI